MNYSSNNIIKWLRIVPMLDQSSFMFNHSKGLQSIYFKKEAQEIGRITIWCLASPQDAAFSHCPTHLIWDLIVDLPVDPVRAGVAQRIPKTPKSMACARCGNDAMQKSSTAVHVWKTDVDCFPRKKCPDDRPLVEVSFGMFRLCFTMVRGQSNSTNYRIHPPETLGFIWWTKPTWHLMSRSALQATALPGICPSWDEIVFEASRCTCTTI